LDQFTFSTTPNIVFLTPVNQALLDFCVRTNIKRVVIVTDKQLVSLGLIETSIKTLSDSGIDCAVFDEVEADPSDTTIKNATKLTVNNSSELVIGFGGGSSLDVAKLVSVLAFSSALIELEDIFGVDQISTQRLPLVLVPTTAGTGSEVTPISIVTTGGNTKAGVVSSVLLPDTAILDPQLTVGLPPHITAATGIDAMVHAIEAYTGKLKKNPLSDFLALKALSLLSGSIKTAVFDGSNIEARADMLLGATLAGQAFANSPVGGVHALAYPLGGHFHIPHGLSNSLVLPHVLRFNMASASNLYAQIADTLCPSIDGSLSALDKSQHLIIYIESLIEELDLPTKLRDCGVLQKDLELLANEALLQTRLLVNNPREIAVRDALAIYQSAF